MNTQEASLCLAELGHATRLNIYRYLVKMGPKPVMVGDIQAALDVPASTLSHHLTRLARVGLIDQRRDGRIIYCTPSYERLEAILQFLTAECCQGEPCVEPVTLGGDGACCPTTGCCD